MLGIVKPQKLELRVKDVLYYKLYYCSVCRHLVRRHNRCYAFANSFEGTLLAMLYNEMVVQDMHPVKDRCSGLPLVKVPVLSPDHEAVRLGALVSLLAFQVKFQDDLEDEKGFWIRRYNQWVAAGFDKSFQQRREEFAEYGIDLDHIRTRQKELVQLEQDRSVRDIHQHLELWGGLFSYIMSQPFSRHSDPGRFTALQELFRGIGQVIYLADSMADLHKDDKTGEFNLILRAEDKPELDNEKWRQNIYNKYRQWICERQQSMLQSLPKLELQESGPILHNILTHGLDSEMQKVFDSMVKRQTGSRHLLFNCQDF